jgi:hypothetical protein
MLSLQSRLVGYGRAARLDHRRRAAAAPAIGSPAASGCRSGDRATGQDLRSRRGYDAPVAGSPVVSALEAIDALDIDAFTSMFAPGGRLLTVDGRVATGTEQVRAAISSFVGDLRSTSHRLMAEWHPEPEVWIAELDATYELNNYTELGPYARALVLRTGTGGIEELRIYGTHELPLIASAHPYQEVFGSGRWLPTL